MTDPRGPIPAAIVAGLLVLAIAAAAWADCWVVSVQEVMRVIDGDTVELTASIWPGLMVTETVRLLGVDTPERKGPTRVAGDAARAFTVEWLEKRKDRLTLRGCGRDAFGRLLAGITADGEALTAALLAAGHAQVFSGR